MGVSQINETAAPCPIDVFAGVEVLMLSIFCAKNTYTYGAVFVPSDQGISQCKCLK